MKASDNKLYPYKIKRIIHKDKLDYTMYQCGIKQTCSACSDRGYNIDYVSQISNENSDDKFKGGTQNEVN